MIEELQEKGKCIICGITERLPVIHPWEIIPPLFSTFCRGFHANLSSEYSSVCVSAKFHHGFSSSQKASEPTTKKRDWNTSNMKRFFFSSDSALAYRLLQVLPS